MALLSRRAGLCPVALALLLASRLGACADPLVDELYRGEPLATFTGLFAEEDERGLIHRDDLRASVFWAPGGMDDAGLDALAEQDSTSEYVSVVSEYVLHIYDEPDPALRVPAAGGIAEHGVGRILVYPDANDNGRRDEDEAFLGALLPNVILFAPRDLAADESPTGVPIPAGFHAIRVPFLCDLAALHAAPTGDCGTDVDLGAPCELHAECGPGGICLLDDPAPWPDGSCGVPEPPLNGCRPEGGALTGAGPEVAPFGYWVAACETDADCDRDGRYRCDLGAGACLPDTPLKIILSVDPQLPEICLVPPSPPGGPGGR